MPKKDLTVGEAVKIVRYGSVEDASKVLRDYDVSGMQVGSIQRTRKVKENLKKKGSDCYISSKTTDGNYIIYCNHNKKKKKM